MDDSLKIKLYSFTVDCKEPEALAKFYGALLGWEVMALDSDWALIYPPGTAQGGYPCVLFQQNPDFVPPVWPDEPGAQQQMAHLDFAVNDLEGAVQHALQCGATVAKAQFSDGWRTMIDPAGHPFCLCAMKALMETEDFGLR